MSYGSHFVVAPTPVSEFQRLRQAQNGLGTPDLRQNMQTLFQLLTSPQEEAVVLFNILSLQKCSRFLL